MSEPTIAGIVTPPAPVVPPAPPAPAPAPLPPVNLSWQTLAILFLIGVGALMIAIGGAWTFAVLTAAPAPMPVPPVPPAPPPAISLTVPEKVTVGDQFVVTSDAVGPVTWIEHGLPGFRGHVGAETQANGRYAGSYAFTAHQKGVYPVIATTIVNGKTVQTRKLLDLTDPAPAPPSPSPTPAPTPTPPAPPAPPAPIAGDGFRVMIVYDSTPGSLTVPQENILKGKTVRDYLDAKTVLGPDGKTHEYRIWPTGADATGESKTWQDAYARSRASVPWIIVSNGKTGFEGPLPATVADAMALLQKYGG